MSLFRRLDGGAWARRRVLKLGDVRFCAALELVGFEAYHAVAGQAFQVVVPAHDHQAVAERAARLYFRDAASITVAEKSGPASKGAPALAVQAEPLPKGRFRIVVAPENRTSERRSR